MPLKLIHGPPNSGRAGRIRRGLLDVLDRDPVLVVPTLDDVYAFEQELCANGAVLGADVMTFGGLFGAVATAGGSPPGKVLTPAQRLGAVAAAVSERRSQLGPLRGSAPQSGFPLALERLLDELQGAGLEPADVEAVAGTLEGSAYLGDISSLFSGYARVRDGLGTVDTHGIARDAINLLEAGSEFWRRPVFLYGLDDLTRNQLQLIRGLAGAAEVTVALPYEKGHTALEARNAPLLESLELIGIDSVEETPADPGNTDSPLLFQLERDFGATAPGRRAPDDESLVFLRSAGERGEAEAIAVEVARLLAGGCELEQIAIVVRDPGRRGPLIASVLESYGIPTALEAEIPASTTSVGGSLIALLEAVLGSGRATDLLRYLRGPAGISPGLVDWFERKLRRDRVQTAGTALQLWEEQYEPLEAVARLRESAGRPADLTAEVGALAAAMGTRVSAELEARAAAAISTAMAERAELEGLAPLPESIARTLAGIRVRVWSGPVEERVRIADPRRVRAARFDNVFVASLQDGEFPRGGAHTDPFLSERQREQLGLQPRHDNAAEERYLFHVCLALPKRRLFLSYRDSDENGAAEAPSPFLEDVKQMLEPSEGEARGRGLAEVVHRLAEAPSETELARAIAARGAGADPDRLLGTAGAEAELADRIRDRLASARGVEAATRAPGPLSNPAVLASLGGVHAYGGTTLEGFDVCSYRWFVSHELSPQPLDPPPDPLVQGGIVHRALHSLYAERPNDDPLPRPGSLAAWIARSRELVGEIATESGLGAHPAERAMLARVEGLLARFLKEEAQREMAGFEPWLLEAGFSESEEVAQPVLEIDGWRLHGAIDRVDRTADGRALVLDYKLSTRVSPRVKLEEEAKLQLQLYLIAVAELWGAEIVGGLYHPLRATSERRPRGLVLEDAAADLAGYGLSKTDRVEREDFEQLLADARRRAGEIVARMRAGQIDRDPGPREGLRDHGICPAFCDFAPICRRDRAPVEPVSDEEEDER
ncbi:MAG TPA: PD-(D/E)XK nuclease family protein [Solirubrobacterales bacterium]|nr:PD-(D/E)XK nuclease family protein [Solirubrobacterales bacterium]